MRHLLLVLVACSAVACEHTAPFQPVPPEPLGPRGTPPVRLTFNPLEDRDPSVSGDTIVFARRPPDRSDGDHCVGFLPAAGGTLLATVCAGGTRADETLDAWFQPVLGPEGRAAYLRQRGAAGAIAPFYRHLVVAPTDSLGQPVLELPVRFDVAGQRANDLRALEWAGPNRLRFVAGRDSFPGMGQARDTLFNPIALVELDLTAGAVEPVPGGDLPLAYAAVPEGGFWIVRADDPWAVLHLAADGTTTEVGRFSRPAVAMTAVAGVPVGAYLVPGQILMDGSVAPDVWLLESLDVATGQPAATIELPGAPVRLAAVGDGRRVVVALRSGGPGDLWLVELP